MLQLAWFDHAEFDPLDLSDMGVCCLAQPGSLWEWPGNGERRSGALANLILVTNGHTDLVAESHPHGYTSANRDADPNIDAYTAAFGITGHTVARTASDNL